ncbi:taste receptor type 2 member 7-like [Scomber scombrus]|uniref:Taste receptor type 2 member 7-like n=1 Tax=Scomber scombrus TaxID=13677 RepID=A0AAV1PF28_SCOSC
MASHVWLTLYYYIQIVPAQRALLIWVKRNIKVIIYMALLLEGIFFLFTEGVASAYGLLQNGLIYNVSTLTAHYNDELYLTNQVLFFSNLAYFVVCLCIMTVCSLSIVHYLLGHMTSVAQSGSSFSTLRSQMRIAITGIFQGVLYFLYSTFYVSVSLFNLHSTCCYVDPFVSFTVTSLYLSGTTVSLGIGQVAFRQGAADLWKTLKALVGVGKVTNDVTLHSVDIS